MADEEPHFIPQTKVSSLPPGAESRMPEIAAAVKSVIQNFPPMSRDKTKELIETENHHGLFRHLEDLIEDHVLDEFMAENQDFRILMASVYSLRHPRLNLEDVGISIMEEGENLDAQNRRREREKNKMTPQEAKERLARSLADFKAEGITFKFDHEMARDALKTTEGDGEGERVPLDPALGGPAPRQPFTTGWRYRVPKVGLPPSFDPKETCDQFLPPPRLPSTKAMGFPGSAVLDEDTDWEGFSDHVEDDDDIGGPVLDAKFTQIVSTVTSRTEAIRRKGEKIRKKQEKAARQKIVGGHLLESPEQRLRKMRKHLARTGRDPSIATLEGAKESLRRQREILEGKSLVLEHWETPGPQSQPQTLSPEELRIWGIGFETSEEETGAEETDEESGVDSDEEMAEGVPETTSERQPPKEKASFPKAGIYDQNWLVKFLEASEMATEEELGFVVYRGWKIHSPKVQLIRIKNFLADEDIDRTLGWDMHFAEIASYLRYLVEQVWDGTQSWAWELKEANHMLQTHWMFQKYNYDDTKLNTHFATPVFEPRLKAPTDAPDIALDGPEPEEVKPRYLIHRIPESIHDVDYQIPGKLLRVRFIGWFRGDVTRVWTSDAYRTTTAGSGERGEIMIEYGYAPDFNMAEVEDETYTKCMHKGTLETSRALHEECNFTFTPGSMITDIHGAVWPVGEASKEWSRFRGAKRAAIQQCLSNFDGSENTHLITPFRKLVLPIPFRERKRLEAEAQKKLAYSNFALKAPPTNVQTDPFCWTHWHRQLMENHDEKARATFKKAQKEFHSCAMNDDKVDMQRVDLTSNNFNGPYVPSFLYRNCEEARKLFKQLSQVHDVLKRACRRAPRPVLKKMLKYVQVGLSDDFEVPDGLDEDEVRYVRDELEYHYQRLADSGVKTPEVYPVPDAKTLWWLRFIAGPSTNKEMIENQVQPMNKMDEVFLDRLQELLDDPWGGGVLSKHKRWASVPKITEAINNKGNASKPLRLKFQYNEAYVENMCSRLAQEGFLWRKKSGKKAAFARPNCDIHPEDRINWRVGDTLDSRGHRVMPEHPLNDEMPPANDGSVLDWHLAAATHLFDERNIAESSDISLRARTEHALILIGLRLGYHIRVSGALVYEAYDQLEADGLGSKPCITVDLHLLQTRDMHNMFWRGSATRSADKTCVSYGAVVRASDESQWDEVMSKDIYNLRAMELVQQNKIRELSEAENMLWPVREVWHTDPDTGETSKTYRRETIWDFAHPTTKRPRKKFFTLDRWPVHLQSDSTAQQIRQSGFQSTHMDIEYDLTAALEQASLEEARQAELARLHAELDEVRQLKEAALQEAAKNTMPVHEAVDPKWQFLEQKEFWLGDTPMQKKSFENLIKNQIETLLPAGKLPGFGIIEPPPTPRSSHKPYDPSAPEVRIPRLPKTLQRRMPRARPYEKKPEIIEEDEEYEMELSPSPVGGSTEVELLPPTPT